ncbi:hypothetical protein AAF712_006563 [Marasmius tenuissimus]|uniref:DUF6535 domain-containing protein n=1 Tax=Marasmius tenuissimus TaxID=585030 RepID=A0ABR2ZYW3_9AGAR
MASTSDPLNQSPSEESKLKGSWQAVMKEVALLDDGLVGGWKEDIDTLLVFAGLFSAVVTAFTIESSQRLLEQPGDTTVALLRQITDQMTNGTSTPPPEFEISSSDLRINLLWFMSLIIALVDALFGLLCKQWLREHHRHTHTCTPAEALALRWLRHESLERWRVPTILACLPMFLELALFLFLGGIIELLRTRHQALFITASVVVGFAGIIYLATTIIPGIHIIRQVLQVTPKLREMRSGNDVDHPSHSSADRVNNLPPMESICPYKSPQAWITFSAFAAFTQLRGVVHLVHFLQSHSKSGWLDSASAFHMTMETLSKWSSVDLEVIHRSNIRLVPPFYELKAFRWLVAELQNSQTMRPHLQRILEKIPLHLVMPVVFNKWFVPPRGQWVGNHIADALSLPKHISSPATTATAPHRQHFISPMTQDVLFDRLLHWTHISEQSTTNRLLPELFRRIWTGLLHDASLDVENSPFRTFDDILKDEETSGADSDLWSLFMGIGQLHTTKHQYWKKLMRDLARYINASSTDYALHRDTASTISPLVESRPDFICEANNLIVDRKIWTTVSMDDTMQWIEAMDVVRRVQVARRTQLVQHSVVDSKPIPEYFPLSLSKLQEVLSSSSSAGSETDFRYLASFKEHWGMVKWAQQERLVEILSEHINRYPRSDDGSLSPLVQSADGSGLDLIGFVDIQLNDSGQTLYNKLQSHNKTAWSDARRLIPQLPRAVEEV